MTSKSKRILYTLIALVLGVGIVLALTMAGEKTKGPIEQILTTASTAVAKVEDKIILEEKTDKRSDKLKWLQKLTADKYWYKHSKAIFLGAFDNNTEQSFQPIIDLEDTLHTTFPLVHIYTAWGSAPEQQFPKSKVQNIVELGSIPVITWEPWLASFDKEAHPELKPIDTRDKSGMTDVANGVYDFYLKKWATQAKKVGSPIFLRLGHEMNDPYRYPWGPQNNTAAEFIAMWHHVHDLFKEVGANNIIWVWSPHPAYGFFKEYYPGDDMVDYIAIGTLNYGPIASWAKWWSFDEIFGKYYTELASFKKPIMLSEFGSLSFGGSRSKWFGEALRDFPKKYPAVKSVMFFHFDADKTATQQVLDWYIIDDKSVVKAITTQMNNWPDSLKAFK